MGVVPEGLLFLALVELDEDNSDSEVYFGPLADEEDWVTEQWSRRLSLGDPSPTPTAPPTDGHRLAADLSIPTARKARLLGPDGTNCRPIILMVANSDHGARWK